MKTIRLLFIVMLIPSFSSYSQINECDNSEILRSEALVIKAKRAYIKELQECFTIFENLLKTKTIELFLEKTDEDFTAFGYPKQSLEPIVNQSKLKNVCIDKIAINNGKSSSIFFSDAENPDYKMVLNLSEKFKYLSWDKVHPVIIGKIQLEGDIVTIPFITIGEWPFIDGEINGVKGRWMFDTGNDGPISLHSEKVVGAIPDTIGSGFVGSGQTFESLEYPLINEVKVGDLTFKSVPNFSGNDMYYLERITPTVIGQVGFKFFKGYDLKMDFLRRELTFYKQIEEGNWKDVKNQKNYITTLKYFTKKLERIPMININHKGIDFLVTFDTGGGKGALQLEDSNFERLKKEGDIEAFYDDPTSLYNFYNIKINEDLEGLNLYGMWKPKIKPSNKPLGITEKNVFSLDYYFLSRYITIWDTKNKEMHIFENK